jgi:hypothetical protein
MIDLGLLKVTEKSGILPLPLIGVVALVDDIIRCSWEGSKTDEISFAEPLNGLRRFSKIRQPV